MVKVIQDTKDMIRDRIFLRKALLIALPVALQGMLNTIRDAGIFDSKAISDEIKRRILNG